jgi:hypothetical protein
MMLTAMTWKLENLFRSGTPRDSSTAGAYGAKLDALSRTINEQQPHMRTVKRLATKRRSEGRARSSLSRLMVTTALSRPTPEGRSGEHQEVPPNPQTRELIDGFGGRGLCG